MRRFDRRLLRTTVVWFFILCCGLVASGARRHVAPTGRATTIRTSVAASAPAYQAQFRAPQVNSVYGPQAGGAGFTTVVTGDFNGDGIGDFATAGFYCANPDGDMITVYLGNGHGGYQTPISYPAGHCIANIAKGHVRGPNTPEDLIVVNAGFDAPGIAILLGNGDGTFAAPIVIPMANPPAQAVIADVNGDGKADVVAFGATDGSSTSVSNIAVLLGHGDGRFDAPVFYPGLLSPQGVEVADVNNDGKPDLVLRTPDAIAISLGNGDGSFLPPYVVLTEPSTLLSVSPPGPIANGVVAFTLGDFNEDGNLDIAAAEDGERVDVILGTGTGTFLPPVTYTNTTHQTGFGGGQIETAKLSNSGHLDLVVTTGYGTTVAIFRGNGDGTFQLTPTVYPLPQYDDEGLVLADVNGDGMVDIVSGTMGGRNSSPNYLTILLNKGNGDFGPAPAQFSNVTVNNNTADPTNPIGVTLADLTGDGKLDLVTTNWGYPVETLSNGQVSNPPTINPGAGTVNPHGTISVFPGNGDGTFGAEQQYTVGARAIAVQARDLTGDGKKDLVVVNGAENTISLLKGNGDRTFQAAVTVPTGNGPNSLAVADLDGDGKPDVAVTNVADNTVSVFLNHSTPGTINFAAGGTFNVGKNPSGIVARDFNHDGKMDLVVTNYGDYFDSQASSTLSFLLGNGDGTFAPAREQVLWPAPLGHGADGVAAADFGNGQQDLAVANFSRGEVMALKSNGDGTFTESGRYIAGAGTEGIVAADFNGDGKIDIAVNNLNDYTVTLFIGNGDGTFVPAAQTNDDAPRPFGWVAWGYPAYLVAGDLTGKGKPDIVVTNIFEQTASVLSNTTAGVPVMRVVSRKIHKAAGPFDIDITGGHAVECRSGGAGGDYTLVFTFANPLTNVGGAAVSAGTGRVTNSQIDPGDSHRYIVNLTGVGNAQRITVTLTDLVDGVGNTSPAFSASVGVLIGDSNGDGAVNSADISQTKSQSGAVLNATNFREDFNADGAIDSADITMAKAQSGTAVQ